MRSPLISYQTFTLSLHLCLFILRLLNSCIFSSSQVTAHIVLKSQHCWLLYMFLCFSVQFRTTPMDSTGVPHILEHTVLCGSEKYPCRDPFFKMLNRSLSTFMNAFTGRQKLNLDPKKNQVTFLNVWTLFVKCVYIYRNVPHISWLRIKPDWY